MKIKYETLAEVRVGLDSIIDAASGPIVECQVRSAKRNQCLVDASYGSDSKRPKGACLACAAYWHLQVARHELWSLQEDE